MKVREVAFNVVSPVDDLSRIWCEIFPFLTVLFTLFHLLI